MSKLILLALLGLVASTMGTRVHHTQKLLARQDDGQGDSGDAGKPPKPDCKAIIDEYGLPEEEDFEFAKELKDIIDSDETFFDGLTDEEIEELKGYEIWIRCGLKALNISGGEDGEGGDGQGPPPKKEALKKKLLAKIKQGGDDDGKKKKPDCKAIIEEFGLPEQEDFDFALEIKAIIEEETPEVFFADFTEEEKKEFGGYITWIKCGAKALNLTGPEGEGEGSAAEALKRRVLAKVRQGGDKKPKDDSDDFNADDQEDKPDCGAIIEEFGGVAEVEDLCFALYLRDIIHEVTPEVFFEDFSEEELEGFHVYVDWIRCSAKAQNLTEENDAHLCEELEEEEESDYSAEAVKKMLAKKGPKKDDEEESDDGEDDGDKKRKPKKDDEEDDGEDDGEAADGEDTGDKKKKPKKDDESEGDDEELGDGEWTKEDIKAFLDELQEIFEGLSEEEIEAFIDEYLTEEEKEILFAHNENGDKPSGDRDQDFKDLLDFIQNASEEELEALYEELPEDVKEKINEHFEKLYGDGEAGDDGVEDDGTGEADE